MQKKIIEQVSKCYGLTIEDMKLNKSATNINVGGKRRNYEKI